MATDSEYLDAQLAAADYKPEQPWQENLMTARKMKSLLHAEKVLAELKCKGTWYETIYRDILRFILTGEVPKSPN